MKQRTFSPIDKPIRTYDLMALDSEGTGRAGDYRIAVVVDDAGAHVFYDRSKLKGWMFTRANREKVILAANLEYDYAVCFQPFRGHWDITLSNRKWIRASYQDHSKHSWIAWDLQRIAPLSVAQMGEIVGLPKYATPPSLIQDPRYHAEEWRCSAHNRLWCIECYCVRDAEITYQFACLYQHGLNEIGGELKMTAASCAMDLFRRRFLRDEIPLTSPLHNRLARDAYYGGRVEAYRLGTARDINVFDINSLYPSVMEHLEVADPSSYRRTDRPSNPLRLLEGFGQFCGTLRLPPATVGLLPYRANGRLYFPVGVMRGSWTLSEVRHALEHGAEIVDTEWILKASRTFKPFGEFVHTLYSLRHRYKEAGRSDEVVVKLNMNSLYGKFAQHDDNGLQSLVVPDGTYRLSSFRGCEPVILAGREAFLRDKSNLSPSPHVHVLWAAEITAQARIRLFHDLIRIPDQLVYCDTDSVHTTGSLPVADRIGAMKIEHVFRRATYFAPKEYGGQDEAGEFVYRAKGIPPAYRSEYLTQGAVEFQQPTHIATAIRSGRRIAEWVSVQKHRRSQAINRFHDPVSDFNEDWLPTFPYLAAQLYDR